MKYPDASIDMWCKPPAESMFFYQSVQAYMTGVIMPMIQFHVYRALERAGYLAIPVAPSGYWRYRDYQEMKGGFYADFSHRHAAVAAGLGDLGLNGLFLSPEFGIRQRMASVITTAPLRPDEPYCGKPLCNNCGRCLKACPVQAFDADERFAVRIGDKDGDLCEGRQVEVRLVGAARHGGRRRAQVCRPYDQRHAACPGHPRRLPGRPNPARSVPGELRMGHDFLRPLPPHVQRPQAEARPAVIPRQRSSVEWPTRIRHERSF